MVRRRRRPEFYVIRDYKRCNECRACERLCAYAIHVYDKKTRRLEAEELKCVGCHFCEEHCPQGAIRIERALSTFSEGRWSTYDLFNIYKQAETGRVLLTSTGSNRPYRDYFSHMVLNAAQVTNPSIDPLREPVEIKTFIGKRPTRLLYEREGQTFRLRVSLGPLLEIESPIMFAAMSYGALSLNACKALAMAACEFGTCWNTGEGGLHEELRPYAHRAIVQVASGRFGVNREYLEAGCAIEIKIGQGAKPGIGGHLPGEKVTEEIAATRMIPPSTDALSPAPHHDIYSIEDLKQLIYALKEATDYSKPVGVKIAAVHNVAAIASGIVRAGADFLVIDGLHGGTGAAPTMIRDNMGIPVEIAIAVVDQRLRDEGIREEVSLIASGGFRNSGDVVKAIALGADAVYIGTAALLALGCHLCRSCHLGKCNWGIATQDPQLSKRLNPEEGAQRAYNLLQAWSLEIKEMLGAMGINAIESLKGNREQLRAVGLNEKELKLLGIKHAGEPW